jgi:hypothetical protein
MRMRDHPPCPLSLLQHPEAAMPSFRLLRLTIPTGR